MSTHLRLLAALLLAPLATGCATTGSTFGSGVGDRLLEHPPYAAGVAAATVAATLPRLAHPPLEYQRGATHPAMFDPADGPGTPVSALVAELNAYLDSLGATTGLTRPLAGGSATGVPALAGERPDVRFGCLTTGAIPDGDCAERGDSALGRAPQAMLLAVGRPSGEWIASMQEAVGTAGVDGVLVLTLEIGQYLPRQTGFRGDKTVELGTGHVISLPWLTSLETPVPVLQLTGAVIGPDGRAVRIAAEGFAARRTPFAASALGAQALIGDAEVEAARTMRRDDLPGQPLAWKVALQELLAQLTGKRPTVGN